MLALFYGVVRSGVGSEAEEATNFVPSVVPVRGDGVAAFGCQLGPERIEPEELLPHAGQDDVGADGFVDGQCPSDPADEIVSEGRGVLAAAVEDHAIGQT